MTIEEKRKFADSDIIWTGDLSDDCTANWAGLMLRAEWMEDDFWWWAVYDMTLNEMVVDSSNEYDVPFLSGEQARIKAESVARTYLEAKAAL